MCYINVFPNHLVLRIWDYFLVYGISFLLSLGLSIVEYFYEDLINNDNPDDILEFFKKLNPNQKSSYKRFTFIDYNIEDLLSNAIKNYSIPNYEINIELKTLFPNYNNNSKYNYIINHKFDKMNSSFLNEKENTIEDKCLLKRNNTKNDKNSSKTNDSKPNNSDIINSSDESYSILEENEIENIELSISQYKYNKLSDINNSDTSCDEIEDENIDINEHIKDLMSKQISLNKKSNINFI